MASSSYDDLSYDQLVLGNTSNIADSHNKPSLKQNKLSLSDSPSTPFSILQAEFKQEEESFSSAPRTTLFPQIFQQFSTFDNNVDAYLNSSSSFSDDQPSFENDFDARISMCEKEMEQVRKQVDQLSKRIITIDMVMNNQVPSTATTTTTTCEKISNKTKDDTPLANLKQTIVETSQNGDDGDLCYKNNNNNNTKNDNNNTSLCIKSDNNYHNHHHHNDLDSANEQSDDSRDSSSASSAASPNDYSYFPSSYRRYNSNYNYTDDDMRDYTNTSISSNESLEEETLKSIQGDHNLSLIKHDINNVKKNINPILKAFKQTFETNNNNRFTPPFYACKDESLLMPSTTSSTTSNNNKTIKSKQNYSKLADNDNSTASFGLKNQNSKIIQKEGKESNKNEISFFNLFKKMLIQRLAKSLHKFDLKTQIQAQSFIELHKRILLLGNDKNNENDDKKSFQQKQKDGDETENEEQEQEDLMSPIWEDEFEMKAFADDDSCDDDDSYDTDNNNHNTNDKNNCQKHKKKILDLDDPIQRQDFLETTFQYLESLE